VTNYANKLFHNMSMTAPECMKLSYVWQPWTTKWPNVSLTLWKIVQYHFTNLTGINDIFAFKIKVVVSLKITNLKHMEKHRTHKLYCKSEAYVIVTSDENSPLDSSFTTACKYLLKSEI